jgi:hypothetical protein
MPKTRNEERQIFHRLRFRNKQFLLRIECFLRGLCVSVVNFPFRRDTIAGRMWFASLGWLLALIPWAVFSIWLLWGRHPNAFVPFLELWRGADVERPPRRGIQRPPIATVLAVTAMLLGILAAAGPRWRGGAGTATPLCVVMDCGLTMSGGATGGPRFAAMAQELADELSARSPGLALRLIIVPGDVEKLTDARGLVSAMADVGPSGVRTDGLLGAVAMRELRGGTDRVIVVSNQSLDVDDPRIIRMGSEDRLQDVGISALAARETPTPQVMVGVLNQSTQTQTTLDVSSVGRHIVRKIDLPAEGGEKNYFFDLPELGSTVEASLAGGDDVPADDRAWLVREDQWPAIEARTSIDPALDRMLEIYSKQRPPVVGSATVVFVDDASKLAGDQRGVIVPQWFGETPAKGAALSVTDHPITRAIDWGVLPPVPATTDAPAGWDPLVSVGGRAVLAVKDRPARQVWVGFSTEPWAESPQFVIFWTNVLDWIGQGNDRFMSSPLEADMAGWEPPAGGRGMPGVYVDGDGAQRAFNAFAAPLPKPAAAGEDWRRQVGGVADVYGGVSLAKWAALAALICVAGAAVTWRKSPANQPLTQLAAT